MRKERSAACGRLAIYTRSLELVPSKSSIAHGCSFIGNCPMESYMSKNLTVHPRNVVFSAGMLHPGLVFSRQPVATLEPRLVLFLANVWSSTDRVPGIETRRAVMTVRHAWVA